MLTLNDILYFNSSFGSYHPSDIDETSDPKYFGFIDQDGNWYILQMNQANGTLRYIKGGSDYISYWTNRASLTYGYFDVVFS